MRIDQVSVSGIPITPPTIDTPSAKNFTDMFMKSIGEVNHTQARVENLVERSATGEDLNPAELAAAVNKADLAFRTMVQIRNKLTQAFDELRQMPV